MNTTAAPPVAVEEETIVARPAERPRRAPRSASKARLGALSWLVVAAILAAWWAVTAFGLVPAHALAAPVDVIRAAIDAASDGELQAAIGASLGRVAIGSFFGVITGLVLGVVAGLSVVGQAVVDRPIQMLRIIPFNALVPLFILFLGIGEPMKIIVVAYAVAVPLYINTFAGIRDVDRKLVEVASVYRIPRIVIAVQVLLRGALPQVLTGLRFALGIAWIALVTVEVVNAGAGLGYMLNQAQQFARTEIILLVVILYGILGALTDWIVRLLERALLRWRSAYSGS